VKLVSLNDTELYTNLKIKTDKTVILSVALYGCETWSFTKRKEHRLRVFENGAEENTVFGPKTNK
jgi:hypothetical protein